MSTTHSLYADGGVIGKNPSNYGGTWAFRLLADGLVLRQESGIVTPETAFLPAITNNLTEMLALVRGLEALPPTWSGTVYSDSQITLGRAFLGWKWKNIPPWLHYAYQRARGRSEHNVWADKACGERAAEFMRAFGERVQA